MKFIVGLYCLLVGSLAFAQREKPKNYRRFDERTIHFGFMLGGNSANFRAIPRLDNYQNYQLKENQPLQAY